jgi:hypothetical protein
MIWKKMPTDHIVRELLENATGPAPWYWNSFPLVESNIRHLTWLRNETDPRRTHSVVLKPVDDADQIVLAVAMYSRVFALPPNLLGLWVEERLRIRIIAINPDALEEFPFTSEPPETVRDFGGFTCSANAVIGEAWTSTDIEQGEHRIELPIAFAGLEKLILIGSYARIQEAACSALFEIFPGKAPGSRRIQVMPQKWFNKDEFDMGYQWITRAVRDQDSGRIVGDGMRVSPFVLTEDGRHIERWIK